MIYLYPYWLLKEGEVRGKMGERDVWEMIVGEPTFGIEDLKVTTQLIGVVEHEWDII